MFVNTLPQCTSFPTDKTCGFSYNLVVICIIEHERIERKWEQRFSELILLLISLWVSFRFFALISDTSILTFPFLFDVLVMFVPWFISLFWLWHANPHFDISLLTWVRYLVFVLLWRLQCLSLVDTEIAEGMSTKSWNSITQLRRSLFIFHGNFIYKQGVVDFIYSLFTQIPTANFSRCWEHEFIRLFKKTCA
jgi:hypothetical protein